jgi:hypothetical protein
VDLEARYQVKLKHDHPLVAWAVRHASFLHVRCQIHENGKTSHHAAYGAPYSSEMRVFGEAVLCKNNVEHREKLALDWSDGLWVGRSTANDEHLVLTKDGIVKSRTVRRKQPEQQVDQQLFDQACGLPWSVGHKPTANVQLTGLSSIAAFRHFEKAVGITAGCPACERKNAGHARHNLVCKKRQEDFHRAEAEAKVSAAVKSANAKENRRQHTEGPEAQAWRHSYGDWRVYLEHRGRTPARSSRSRGAGRLTSA